MTKTLSEQLCEIVGLEIPGKLVFRKRNWDKKTYINSGHGYKEFDFKSQPDAYVDIIPTRNWDEKNGFSFPYSAIENIKKIYDEHGYDFIKIQTKRLDFEQPENFVKLLELKTEDYGTILDIISTDYSLSTRIDFLQCLYLRLATNAYSDIDQIKQSIRDYDGWVWG